MDKIELNLLKEIADLEKVPDGAFNLRENGELKQRNTTANIDIVSKSDKSGIDIIIKPNTKNERIDIPVIITKTGVSDLVYNDFYIGENAEVLIVAGCGIHNCGTEKSQHDGIHTFHIGKNAKIKYVEKHYGEGDGMGRLVRENCDYIVSIPMVGRINSLNASSAASIIMYEVLRQRSGSDNR